MGKYRKVPVEIDAWQYGGLETIPDWLSQAFRDEKILLGINGTLEICALEGKLQAKMNDWIILGVKGELYQCKPDIFEITYEVVEND